VPAPDEWLCLYQTCGVPGNCHKANRNTHDAYLAHTAHRLETQKGTMIRDAGLILAAQKVEHYEIATYGGLSTLASMMEHG